MSGGKTENKCFALGRKPFRASYYSKCNVFSSCCQKGFSLTKMCKGRQTQSTVVGLLMSYQ